MPSAHRRRLLLVSAAALGLALAVCLVGTVRTTAQPATLWRPVLNGLYGDRVLGLAFVGQPGSLSRSLLMLPEGYGLYRWDANEGTWPPVAANPDRPTGVVRSVRAVPGDADGLQVYAGLEGRVLFARSQNAGFAWEALTGPSGPRRLDLLAVTKAGKIYAGEAGASSLWVSVDKGDNWSELAGPPPAAPIQQLIAAPDDPIVYVVSDGHLHRLDPNGTSWTEVLGPTTVPAQKVSLAAIGARGRLYAAGQAGGAYTLLSSEDRGSTWPGGGWPDAGKVTPRSLVAGETQVGLPSAWLGLEDGHVFQTTDGGSNWAQLDRLPIAVSLVAVDPASGDVWAGSDGLGLFKLSEPQLHTGAVPVEALSIVGPTYDSDQQLLLDARVRPPRRDAFGAQQPAVYGLFNSAGGDIWTRRMLTDVLGTRLLASPAYATDQRLYSGQQLSVDGGYDWRPLATATGGGVPTVVSVGPMTGTLPVVYALQVPYVGGVGGTGLFRSETGGDTWVAADASVDHIVDLVVSPRYTVQREVLFITDTGSVYRAMDGLTFSQIGQVPAAAPNQIVYDLVMSPDYAADNTLFAAIEDPSSTQRAHVYVSTKGGVGTWKDRSRDLPVRGRPRRLVLSPTFKTDGVLFLGAERLIGDTELPLLFGTDSAGDDWYGEQSMLPPAITNDFGWMGPLRGGKLFAAMGAAGLWVRDLNGPPVGPTATATATSTATMSKPTLSPTPAATGGATTDTPPATPTATPNGTQPTDTDPTTTSTPTATASGPPSPTHTERPATATPTAVASATLPIPDGRTVYLPFAYKSKPR